LYRGGYWNNGTNAGVFYANLNNSRSNSNTNIGGRSALPPDGQVCTVLRDCTGSGEVKGVCFRSIGKMEKMTDCCGGGNVTRRFKDGRKTLDNVFHSMTSFERLNEAYRNARKKKRYRDEILNFSSDLDSNLLKIQKGLRNGKFRFGPYRKHWVYVPKKRLVMALPFESRIAQWVVYLELNPFYDKLMIEDSYACRKKKGSLKAAKRLQYWMQLAEDKPGDWYYLKIDISKYFYRVDHEVLIEILGERIEDEQLMDLLRTIIDSDGEKFGLPRYKSAEEVVEEEWLGEVGMPIGNLTSQLFANIYLNELDQYCKHVLGIKMFVRYMDDVIIIAKSKAEALRYKAVVEKFLLERLHLDLNNKTAVRPLGKIEFVGYIVEAKRMKLRKQTVRRIKSAFHGICKAYFTGELEKKEFDRRVASYKGMVKNVDNEKLKKRLNEIYLFEKKKAGKLKEAA
jgi:retron-type reverse transcriptase